VCCGAAKKWLAKMSEFVAPERFLAARPDTAVEP